MKMNKESEFIYLVPGNWFELRNINIDKIYPFDIDEFQREILNQVNSRSDKLSFIDIAFGKKYSNNTIENIDFYLDKNKFNNITELISGEIRHPIITFHGTSNLNAVNSILENGYIIPGVKDPNKNIVIKRTHGSVYGIGIYSSPFFDKAMCYTTPDKIKYVYVLVNIVILGKFKLIPPDGSQTLYHNPPTNGCYSDGSNTRIVYGLEQLVCADPKRIIPIAVMKISIS